MFKKYYVQKYYVQKVRKRAVAQDVPITNYGICIAQVHGILKRSVELFPDVLNELKEIEISTLTPIEALNILNRLQNRLKNRW